MTYDRKANLGQAVRRDYYMLLGVCFEPRRACSMCVNHFPDWSLLHYYMREFYIIEEH